MNNKQKLELLLKLQRRDKRRRIMWIVAIVSIVGGGIVFSQYMNMS